MCQEGRKAILEDMRTRNRVEVRVNSIALEGSSSTGLCHSVCDSICVFNNLELVTYLIFLIQERLIQLKELI